MTDKKIAIIGSGSLGTAFARVLYNGGKKDIVIYGIDNNELEELSKGTNTKYFPNSVELPNFKTTNNLDEALEGVDVIVLTVPSSAMGVIYPQILGTLKHEALIICGSKGFFPGTTDSLQEGLEKLSKGHEFIKGVVSLIGPSHAEEIVLDQPTAVAAVTKNKEHAGFVQKLFSANNFKVYIQTDVRGAEAGAAYKNALAIASGMADGFGFGINTNAALITRGMVELIKLNKIVKGKQETLMGLTGLGDIIVTATSDLSRNYTLGKNLALHGKKALDSKVTVEGVKSLKIIKELADNKQVEMPIINFLYSVIYGDADPKSFYEVLWERELKAE